jgi:hypothetical protein
MEKGSLERCTRQFVLIVARNARFRSNPTEQDQSTAKSALRKEGHRDDPTEDPIGDTSFFVA